MSISALRRVDPETRREAAAPLRVVLLGLGTVGTGVYQLLAQRPDVFDIRRVVVRHRTRVRDVAIARDLLSTNLWDAINEPADLVLELVGGVATVAEVVHAALIGGRTVITANKALVARRWRQLAGFARGAAPQLRFSAAVGGEVPVLETLRELSVDDAVTSVRGVVNGTCNFVLDRIEAGATFAEAVAEAQAQGFAEADPRADLGGEDAGHKLELIARAAFHCPDVLRFDVQGIEHLTPADLAAARAQQRRIRLVATCRETSAGITGTVRPESLAADDCLAATAREENRVEITTRSAGTVRLCGRGAGRWPTARSVLADLHAHLRAQLRVASTQREPHARRVEAVGLLENELAFHQAEVTGE
jgi:homoserine dehydrogenase